MQCEIQIVKFTGSELYEMKSWAQPSNSPGEGVMKENADHECLGGMVSGPGDEQRTNVYPGEGE